MKKILAFFVALAALGVFGSVQEARALSIGAPARTLERGDFSLSGAVGYTKLDIGNENVKSKSFLLKGAFASGDGVMPYLKLGFADMKEGSFKGSLDFAFGGGVLLDLLSQEGGSGFKASLDAQILWSGSSDGGVNRDMTEGQLSLLGSVRTGGTNAYAGISSSFIDLSGGGVNESENGQGHLFFGMDYYMDYNFYFNAEAHLFGQDMVSVGVGYQF